MQPTATFKTFAPRLEVLGPAQRYLRRRGHDAVHLSDHLSELGLERLRDPEILALAAEQKRIAPGTLNSILNQAALKR